MTDDRFSQLAVRLSHAVDDARALPSTPLTDEQHSQITAYLTQIASALKGVDPR